MNLDPHLLGRLDLKGATELELTMSNRLMPRRADRTALSGRAEEIARLLKNRYAKGQFGDVADVVFVDKNRRGRRPISEMTLRDRVLLRALVNLIAQSLPGHLVNRVPNADFKRGPLQPGVNYVSKTDVVAYYEFVDHARLADELEAQTGEAPAIDALMELLFRVMGRRVGLPQVHQSSDILGDTYIDPVRRRMRRAGFDVTTYSDDFRIATKTLGEARRALETCAREVRALGLTLNEGKTYTYTDANYLMSLTAFADAERKLFEEVGGDSDDVSLLFLSDYPDESVEPQSQALAGTAAQPVTEDDVLDSAGEDASSPTDDAQERAAIRAWEIWLLEDESDEQQSKPEAAITETLLGRALPILGRRGFDTPVRSLSQLLRFEPALTPQIAAYIKELAGTTPLARTKLRNALDRLVSESILSTWQKIWLADAAGSIRAARTDPPHYAWLRSCLQDAEPALAATAASALGRLGRADTGEIKAALDGVGPVFKPLVLWSLSRVDAPLAEALADDRLERILVEVARS
jgi:hypothetical protein